MNAIIILNPFQKQTIPKYADKCRLMGTPIINPAYKKDYPSKKIVRIFWDGYANNMYTIEKLNKIIRTLSQDLTQQIEMIYNSNMPVKNEGIIKYTKWSIDNWQEMIISADIGVVIKPLDDKRQQKKPATKVISYMSSGLPVICTPSAADKLVMQHVETGFFAYTDEEWYQYLKTLIENPDLRQKIGIAARKSATKNFNLQKVATDYTNLFDELILAKNSK